MAKYAKLALVIGLVAALASPSYAAWFLNYEWGVGQDQQVISSGVPGLQFTTTAGQDWIYGDGTTGNWNVQDQFGNILGGNGDFYMFDKVFAWLGPNQGEGRIDFLNGDGSFFTTGYCSASNFYVEAYDASNNLLDVAVGAANVDYNDNTPGPGQDFLTVSSGAGNIAYVLLHDTGNFWEIDNSSGDATGVVPPTVPEPTTMLLLGSGLLGLGIIRRKK